MGLRAKGLGIWVQDCLSFSAGLICKSFLDLLRLSGGDLPILPKKGLPRRLLEGNTTP